MAVALSADGALLAAGCVDALVRVWDVRTGALVEVLRGHQNSVHSVVFASREGGGGGGMMLVTGALDNTVRCWDLRRQGRAECTVFTGHKVRLCRVGSIFSKGKLTWKRV
jgi:glucose repression regulatory protein TUP1